MFILNFIRWYHNLNLFGVPVWVIVLIVFFIPVVLWEVVKRLPAKRRRSKRRVTFSRRRSN